MASPQDIYNQIISDARAKVEAREAEARQKVAANADTVAPILKSVSETLPRIVEQTNSMAQRLEAIERAQAARTTRPVGDDDPYKPVSEYGLNRENLGSVIQHEVGSKVKEQMEREFETRFGPSMREAAAIQEYQKEHPDFDLTQLNQYLVKNPEVQQIVDQARQKGAYQTGIEYAELRRTLDTKIQQEARGQARAQKRSDLIDATRADAAIIGGTGANSDTRSKTAPSLTADHLEKAYAHANAGDWSHFEKMLVNPSLPDEQWFQALSQS